MAEHVGALYKLGCHRFNCKLNLRQIFLLIDNVDQDIIGALFEPILDPNYLHELGLFQANFF